MRSLLSLVAICAVASALTTRSTSKYTVPFKVDRRFSLPSRAGKTIVQHERERMQQHIANRHLARAEEGSSANSVAVTNSVNSYHIDVDIGSPSTTYTLLIDTGSSNTWVGAGKPFVSTSTTTQTFNNVSAEYASGSFSGTQVFDQLALSPDLVIQQQGIGIASQSVGVVGTDGLLGIGPTGLTLGTLASSPNAAISTVVDSLRMQGTIESSLISIFFAPGTSSDASSPSGELTFGTTDPAKMTTPLNFVPLTETMPAAKFWGFEQSVDYGGENILSTTVGIIDSGTTLVLLASDAFALYKDATGAVHDNTTGFLQVTEDQFKQLQPLNFNIGGQVYTLTPNAQLFPRSNNANILGQPDAFYLAINDLGQNSGSGFDFIMGYAFLERFYTVLDTDNERIGFAETEFTDATTN